MVAAKEMEKNGQLDRMAGLSDTAFDTMWNSTAVIVKRIKLEIVVATDTISTLFRGRMSRV